MCPLDVAGDVALGVAGCLSEADRFGRGGGGISVFVASCGGFRGDAGAGDGTVALLVGPVTDL